MPSVSFCLGNYATAEKAVALGVTLCCSWHSCGDPGKPQCLSAVWGGRISGCLQNALFKIILPQKKAFAVSTPWSDLWGWTREWLHGPLLAQGLRKREGGRRPQRCSVHRAWSLDVTSLGMCLVNLQSVELWQVLESRLSNKLDGIVIKMAAMGKRDRSESAAHKEKILLQVKSPRATSSKPCRRCCWAVRNSFSQLTTGSLMACFGWTLLQLRSPVALSGPFGVLLNQMGWKGVKPFFSPTEKHLALLSPPVVSHTAPAPFPLVTVSAVSPSRTQ